MRGRWIIQTQDQLAESLAFLQDLVGFGDFFQRQDSIDDGHQMAGFHQVADPPLFTSDGVRLRLTYALQPVMPIELRSKGSDMPAQLAREAPSRPTGVAVAAIGRLVTSMTKVSPAHGR